MNRLLAASATCALLLLLVAGAGHGQPPRVFDENPDDLPPGCTEITEEASFTVRGGTEHAAPHPGRVWTFDERVWEFPACARLTVTFVNDDAVRHQWMVHGVYPNGTFALEVSGPGEATGSFILPSVRSTLLVHCGVEQHQQKGMKGEILVDGGLGHLPNIIGVSGIPERDRGTSTPIAYGLGGSAFLLVGATVWRRPEP